MMRFAEERGQIGGQGIDEGFPFVAVLLPFQFVQIDHERHHSGRAQAPRQAAVDHFLLAVGQGDAGALINQAPHPVEITRGEVELLGGTQFILRLGCFHGSVLFLFYV